MDFWMMLGHWLQLLPAEVIVVEGHVASGGSSPASAGAAPVLQHSLIREVGWTAGVGLGRIGSPNMYPVVYCFPQK